MVGVGTMLGVFVCEAIMRYADNPTAFYPVTIVATLALAGVQWLWLNGAAPEHSHLDPHEFEKDEVEEATSAATSV